MWKRVTLPKIYLYGVWACKAVEGKVILLTNEEAASGEMHSQTDQMIRSRECTEFKKV